MDPFAPLYLLSILGSLTITAGLWLLRRRQPGLLAAWLSYLATLAPNAGLVRLGNTIAADRYSYMSMIGGVVLLAAGLVRLGPALARRRTGAIAIVAVGCGAILGLSYLTWEQCRIWRNSLTLWGHAVAHGAADSYVAHNNPGHVFWARGRCEEAKAHFDEAFRLNPGVALTHSNLGLVLGHQRKFDEAIAEFDECARIDPDAVEAHNNLGSLLARQGRPRKRWPNSTRPCGSTPTPPSPTAAWAWLLARAGEGRRGGSRIPRGAADQPRLPRGLQWSGSTPDATGTTGRGDGSLPRGATNRPRQGRTTC